ncbi:E3 ubiquitin/ISG15 ligase TRIM25-like isoform X2 [Pimephales promelas]|uniref:E3 ubiquitin/ISG15 ligase TRIM25-like isoform X2 n=1 Tax=Pimephales promelas TaxID=90988 RepID=UPI0019555214|nr:E3 ubiquitin/ISG15 ligase TRIM25-like isoform X2 [Pimephales promelas]
MNLNEPLDFSQPKRKRSETERTAKKHAKNKRQKSKRAASPTSSYLSMRTDYSMDPPTNFKSGETFPLHSRIKRERETSPVTGCISLRSDNPVNASKGIASDLSVKAAWSIDPPTNLKAAETFPLDPRFLTEQDLMCRVCKSMLKDPVSMPCGHNYCNACINAFWDNCAGEYGCPHCGKASETRPVLSINADLAEVVKYKQQTGFSPALPQQSYAGPEDVACDFCFGRKLKSVKSCLTCDVVLCETHVREHYTVPALEKHTLVDVIKTRPSEQSQNSDNSFSCTAGGQQPHADIKEMAVAAKLQTRLKRSAKTFRPKTKEKKDHVKKIALMCSTLQQEVSGLKEKLSKLEKKNTKKEYEDEEEYDDEEDDFGEEEDDDDEEEEEEEEDYGDYDEDGDDNEDYSEKDFDAETYEEEEDDEDELDSLDDEDENKEDWEEDDWEENEDMEDYDDEDSSEKDSDEDYDDPYY